MAGRDGSSSILRYSRGICRMVGLYGMAGFNQRYQNAGFAAAVVALVAACQAFEALDDQPGQIDQTLPTGVEDEPPAEG
jgi:hypothetical protein